MFIHSFTEARWILHAIVKHAGDELMALGSLDSYKKKAQKRTFDQAISRWNYFMLQLPANLLTSDYFVAART